MRIARYAIGGDVSFGVVSGPSDADPAELSIAQVAGHPFAPVEPTGVVHRLPEVRLLAPVLPSKVVCIGKNYADHAAEMGGEAPATPSVVSTSTRVTAEVPWAPLTMRTL